jgi:hypothetical protein
LYINVGKNKITVLQLILPNLIFLCFPIFAVKLSHPATYKNDTITIKWPSLKAKKEKNICFTKKKTLVGLTPDGVTMNECTILQLVLGHLIGKISLINTIE